jgi:GAF domain-containing protein
MCVAMSNTSTSENPAPGEHVPDTTGSSGLAFADLPRLELEKLLADVATRAQDVLTTQGRLRALLRAHAVVASDLSLPAVLQHVVAAARQLVEARYAALGVLDEQGQLDQFVHVGMDPDTVARIGDLPVGRGMLGLLISDPTPVRLVDLREHPAATGFPAHHPAMDSFLGVPIRIRDQVFGNLYLTGSANGAFTEEDEQLAVALAATAGVAIDNARLYQRSEQRHQWLTASSEVAQRLFAGRDEHPLDLVLRYAQDSAEADFATLALFTETGQLQVRAASGVLAERLSGLVLDLEHSLAGQVARSGTPVLSAAQMAVTELDLPVKVGSVVVVPLLAGAQVVGTLSVGRLLGRRPFTTADTDHIAGFAGHAGVAIELDRARADQQDLRIADEQARISLDLNDHVIQKLFSVSLGLEGLVTISTRPAVRERLSEYVGVLDDIIGRIRGAVYDVGPTRDAPESLRHRLETLVGDEALVLGCRVDTVFTGYLNVVMPAELVDDMVAVARGAMGTIARGARASTVELRVDVLDDRITVEVIDDGPVAVRMDVLLTFRRTAESHGGTLDHFTPPGGGTHLIWTARIPEPA